MQSSAVGVCRSHPHVQRYLVLCILLGTYRLTGLEHTATQENSAVSWKRPLLSLCLRLESPSGSTWNLLTLSSRSQTSRAAIPRATCWLVLHLSSCLPHSSGELSSSAFQVSDCLSHLWEFHPAPA